MMEVPEDILSKYVERRRKDLEICQVNFAQKQYEDLVRVGHQLKGNGVTFGFTELSQIGQTMEVAALEKNISDLKNALDAFSSWVNSH